MHWQKKSSVFLPWMQRLAEVVGISPPADAPAEVVSVSPPVDTTAAEVVGISPVDAQAGEVVCGGGEVLNR